jgi:zinc transport system permease protein
VRNLPVVALHLALLCVVAVTVVLLMRVVGLILVIAMLTIPVAVSTQFVRTLRATMLSSVILAAAFTLVGLWLSLQTNLTSSATIILVSATGFVFAIVAQRLRAILMSARQKSAKGPLA